MSPGMRVAVGAACTSTAIGLGSWATRAEAAHPRLAVGLYVLALFAVVGLLIVVFLPARPVPVGPDEWREQARRFGEINKKVGGHWERHPDSRVLQWSIWPSEGGSPRDRELFEGEAIHASRLLKRMLGYSEDKYVTWFGSNEVDQWLTAIRSLVHPGTDMESSGVDENGRKSAGRYVDELPTMSAIACVKLAAGVRPRVGLPTALE